MRWKYRLNIRQYLTEDESRESMLRAAAGIGKEVSLLPVWPKAASIMSELSEAADRGSLTWFNAVLDKLWDFCDEEKIWVPT